MMTVLFLYMVAGMHYPKQGLFLLNADTDRITIQPYNRITVQQQIIN